MSQRSRKDIVVFVITLTVLMLLPVVVSEYYLYIARLVFIYGIVALGLNVFMGFCGQINLGSAAFFCMGAYISTILQVKLGWHFVIGSVVGVALSVMIAWIMSWPLLRLKGHSMAIGTLAFAMAVYLVVDRYTSLTGGSDGINVPSGFLFGQKLGDTFYYYLALTFLAAGYLVCEFLINSPVGRAIRTIKGDELAASAMGANVQKYKRFAWLISGLYGAVGGAICAQQAGFLSPSTFSLNTNITILIMICVGGLGSNLGAVVGATIMTLLSFFLVTIEEFIVLVYGITLFLVLRFMPNGIVGVFIR